MKLLVTGGAGYIGSQTVKLLKAAGHDIVVLDNLSNGHREAIPDTVLEQIDLLDTDSLEQVFKRHRFDAVVHFAAVIEVGESVVDPAKYFQINLVGGLNLLEMMRKYHVARLIFSSTAAVYGEPTTVPITEDTETRPGNPYGLSKLQFEQILQSYDAAYGIKSVALRYFNAAGADLDGALGNDHQHKTHLISVALLVAAKKLPKLTIYGTDYPTPDGTGIRDYIHVVDLAHAHVAAIEYLDQTQESSVINLGTEAGSSVLEVIAMVERITGQSLPVEFGERRPGDSAQVIASNSKAQKLLGWKPEHSDLETIIQTAWRWLETHPNGYRDIHS